MVKVAVLLDDDFEDSEFSHPVQELKRAGHRIEVLGAEAGKTVKGKQGKERATIDAAAAERDPDAYDLLLIPGGYSPDHLRMDAGAVEFTRRFAASGKPIAAVCHGPQLLIEADAVKGRTLTSWPSVRKDLENAGATWVDREVVEDDALISARGPKDLPAFSKAILARLG